MNGHTAKLLRKYASVVDNPKKLNGDDLRIKRPEHASYQEKRYDALKRYWKRQLNHRERHQYREFIKDELEDRYGVFVPGRDQTEDPETEAEEKEAEVA